MSSVIVWDIAAVAIAVLITIGFFTRGRARAFPPGPRGWPLIGNVFDMPKAQAWKTFAQWGDRWGDMVYMNVLGQPIVVLNSAQRACEMLEKKGTIYSDRPTFTFLGKIIGWDRIATLMPYGTRHRETRRMFTPVLGSRASIAALTPVMEDQIGRFLPRLIRYPDDVVEQVLKTVTGTILSTTYGYRPREENDRFVQIVKPAIREFSIATIPGSYLVDILPILRYLPSWMPGAAWKREVKAWKKDLNVLRDEPFAFVKEQMAAGSATPSFTAANLQGDITPEREELVKQAASSIYAGGEDTSHAAIVTFFLAMMHYPDVLKKAQRELDTVIGTDRVPLVGDRERLPYVNALVSEVLRWAPPVPLGMPHRLMEDDVHAGYFLPKGTIVLTNIWQMLHDPEVYADPFTFNPDRFLPNGDKKPEPDPREVLWGFGRRVCPGQYLADSCIYLALVKTIATFDITKPVENGVVIEPVIDFTTGTVSHPVPFKCKVTPRSAKAEALVLETSLDD